MSVSHRTPPVLAHAAPFACTSECKSVKQGSTSHAIRQLEKSGPSMARMGLWVGAQVATRATL